MADRIPVILSEDRTVRAEGQRLQKRLVEALSQWPDVQLTVVPHLYDLSADGPGIRLVQSINDDLIVLAWLYPRSAFWVLDANRVRGRLGRTFSLPDEEPDQVVTRVDAADVPDRTIWCLDLRTHDRPEPYLEEIGRIALRGQGSGVRGQDWEVERAVEPLGAGLLTSPTRAGSADPRRAREIEEAASSRWYPVIDYSRCTNCLECLNFCLFGVYGLDESEVVTAEEPDACRAGCPACARICPAGAIMFPAHKDPAIAGDPKASLSGLKLDLSQLFGGADPAQMAAAERDRALAARRRDEALSSQADTDRPPAKDDLDRLVDEVDELDL